MRNEKQAFMKEDGAIGDCWRCCIAALLNLPRDQVPHFYKETLVQSAETQAQAWLNERGYVLISGGPFYFMSLYECKIDPIQPFIASGPTIRSKKMREHHAVIMLGEKMVYDPHPSEAGILAIVERELILPMLPGIEVFK